MQWRARDWREEARGRRIYGVAAKLSGGEIERRRQNRAVAAWVGRERARVKFLAVGGFARLPNDVARCSRRLRYGAPDRAKHPAHQIFCSAGADRAPAGGPNLSLRALYRRLL
jgi:hypothetical protein